MRYLQPELAQHSGCSGCPIAVDVAAVYFAEKLAAPIPAASVGVGFSCLGKRWSALTFLVNKFIFSLYGPVRPSCM